MKWKIATTKKIQKRVQLQNIFLYKKQREFEQELMFVIFWTIVLELVLLDCFLKEIINKKEFDSNTIQITPSLVCFSTEHYQNNTISHVLFYRTVFCP